MLRARGLHVGFHPHPLKTLSGILDASPRFGKIRTGVYHLIRQDESAGQGNGQHASL